MITLNFIYPQFLIFLISVPALIFIHIISIKLRRGRAIKFANFEAISRVKGVDFYSKNVALLAVNIAVCVLLVFSLSGAQIHRDVLSSSSSFVIAIDSSRSMEATDIAPSRISAAKEIASDFADGSPLGTRIGIISFSGNSYVQKEVDDRFILTKSSINSIELSSIGGTDLYEAVITSVNLLSKEKFKSVILLSDGQVNVGNIEEAISYANENNVIVNTIGIGSESGGETSYGISKFDEDALKSLAYNTNGAFFKAGSKEEIKNSFDSIRALKQGRVAIDLSDYFLILAVILVIFSYFYSSVK